MLSYKCVEDVMSTAHRRDGVKRKLKLNSPNTKENSKRKSCKQDRVRKSEEHEKIQRRLDQNKQKVGRKSMKQIAEELQSRLEDLKN